MGSMGGSGRKDLRKVGTQQAAGASVRGRWPCAPAGNRLSFRFLLIAGLAYLPSFFGYEQWLTMDAGARAGAPKLRGPAWAPCGRWASAEPGLSATPCSKPMNNRPLARVFPAGAGVACLVWRFCAGLARPLAAQAVVCLGGQRRRLGFGRAAGRSIGRQAPHTQQSVNFKHLYTGPFLVHGFICRPQMPWARGLVIVCLPVSTGAASGLAAPAPLPPPHRRGAAISR